MQDTEKMINEAAKAAVNAALPKINQEFQEALNLSMMIGAQIGAQYGAEEALKALEREKKRFAKEQRDKRLHNTKLLLKNYRSLKSHAESSISDVRRLEESGAESIEDIMRQIDTDITDDALYIESIKKSCARTKIIMAHVDKMLEIYREMCEKSNRPGDARHWRVLESLYLSDRAETASAIADREHIERRTVYKDIDSSVAALTTLFFGISAMENS